MDIKITCRKCSVTNLPNRYALIQNAGPKGRSALVAKFLQRLGKRGAFVVMSDGYGLENSRIEGFVAYCKAQGFTTN